MILSFDRSDDEFVDQAMNPKSRLTLIHSLSRKRALSTLFGYVLILFFVICELQIIKLENFSPLATTVAIVLGVYLSLHFDTQVKMLKTLDERSLRLPDAEEASEPEKAYEDSHH